ncbi:MAG: sulfite exporter TauE/SafE family protein [Oscillospiraceae bacterium]
MLIFFAVSLLASTVGAICGIGGGVIIKPVLDMLHLESVSTISFLSGCTVLSMSCYSVGKTLVSQERQVDMHLGTPLAIGAAVGGLVGKQLFTAVRGLFENPNTVGAVQAVCLALITAGTLIYTVCKSRIATKQLSNRLACVMIGLLLGIMSSFLGIGGGPINLVVLYYFFSMDTKTAAANSLYIILFSQAASLVAALVTGTVPEFRWGVLALMVVGGIGGGIIGRSLNKKMSPEAVERLFIILMIVIIGINIYNSWHYIMI